MKKDQRLCQNLRCERKWKCEVLTQDRVPIRVCGPCADAILVKR